MRKQAIIYRVLSAVGVAGEFSTLKQAKRLVAQIKASGITPAALRIERVRETR